MCLYYTTWLTIPHPPKARGGGASADICYNIAAMSSPLQLLCLCTLFAAVAANPARAAKEAASGAGAIPVSIRDLHDEKYYSKSVSVTGTIVDVLSD